MAYSNGSIGSCPYKTKAGIYSMLAKQVKLSANLAAGKSTSQSPLVKLMKQDNNYFTKWFIYLVCLSICGWYAVDKACSQPRIEMSSYQKYEVKHRSQAKINLHSIPYFATIVAKINRPTLEQWNVKHMVKYMCTYLVYLQKQLYNYNYALSSVSGQ